MVVNISSVGVRFCEGVLLLDDVEDLPPPPPPQAVIAMSDVATRSVVILKVRIIILVSKAGVLKVETDARYY